MFSLQGEKNKHKEGPSVSYKAQSCRTGILNPGENNQMQTPELFGATKPKHSGWNGLAFQNPDLQEKELPF